MRGIQRRWQSRVRAVALICAAVAGGAVARAGVLLNDSWTDGSRAETNLPNESALWAGVSATDTGTLTVSPGSLNNTIGTSSRKLWEYFTSDLSAPNGSQPHNSVTHLNVGDVLTASMNFTLPNGATSTAGSAGRDFRIGLFLDPTDARVQADVNNDGGGSASPWADATGYDLQIPLNSNAANTTALFQMGKRTVSNTSLAGASGAYTFAPTGGAPVAVTASTPYTVTFALNRVGASQLDVTASLLQGSTLLSTQTVSDLGSTFGGAAVPAGLPGNTGVYSDFDQLFFRMSSNTTAGQINFTNWKVELTQAPEPGSLGVLALAAAPLMRRRRRA